jgi:hypothetical protein
MILGRKVDLHLTNFSPVHKVSLGPIYLRCLFKHLDKYFLLLTGM